MAVYYTPVYDLDLLSKILKIISKYSIIKIETMNEKEFRKNYDITPWDSEEIKNAKHGDAIAVKINGKVFIFWLGAWR